MTSGPLVTRWVSSAPGAGAAEPDREDELVEPGAAAADRGPAHTNRKRPW